MASITKQKCIWGLFVAVRLLSASLPTHQRQGNGWAVKFKVLSSLLSGKGQSPHFPPLQVNFLAQFFSLGSTKGSRASLYLITREYTIPPKSITQAFTLRMNSAQKPCPGCLGEWESGTPMPPSLKQNSDLCSLTQADGGHWIPNDGPVTGHECRSERTLEPFLSFPPPTHPDSDPTSLEKGD